MHGKLLKINVYIHFYVHNIAAKATVTTFTTCKFCDSVKQLRTAIYRYMAGCVDQSEYTQRHRCILQLWDDEFNSASYEYGHSFC